MMWGTSLVLYPPVNQLEGATPHKISSRKKNHNRIQEKVPGERGLCRGEQSLCSQARTTPGHGSTCPDKQTQTHQEWLDVVCTQLE
jgi:hypothetical protein